MSDKEMKKLLKGMQGAYDEAADAAFGIPDGQYRLQLLEASLTTAKQSGKVMLKRMHTVLDGELEGRNVYDNIVLGLPGEENVVGWSIARQWVELCGYDPPEDAVEMLDICAGITEENPVVIAQVETNDNGFTNVRVTELEEEAAQVTKKTKEDEEEEEGDVDTGEFQEGDKVKFEDEEADDGYTHGTIVDFEDDQAHIEDDDGEVWITPIKDLEKDEKKVSKKPSKKDKKTTGPKPADDDKALLLAFAQAQGIANEEDLDDDTSKKKLITILSEYEWDSKTLTKGETELLDNHEIPYK